MNDILPREAAERIEAGETVHFIDVRSRREFRAGHPASAVNIPLAEPSASGQMEANPEFALVVESLVPDRSSVIFLSCQMGGRSRRAMKLLAKRGYENLFNVEGGFGGRRDPHTGEILVAGWQSEGLPVSDDNSEGVSYESLRARAGFSS